MRKIRDAKIQNSRRLRQLKLDSEKLEGETKIVDIPVHVREMPGFSIVWNNYQEYLKKEKEKAVLE